MMICPINKNDLDGGLAKGFCRSQAAKPAADDHYAGCVTGAGVIVCHIWFWFPFFLKLSGVRNLIAGQGLPFETLCIESCLTAVVVVTGGLAVGHGIFERDSGDFERLQECRGRVAEHPVGVSAAD